MNKANQNNINQKQQTNIDTKEEQNEIERKSQKQIFFCGQMFTIDTIFLKSNLECMY